jgi:hypothetical protein
VQWVLSLQLPPPLTLVSETVPSPLPGLVAASTL